MKINFLLTGEGSSDLNLQSHIESLLIREGFSEADGESPDLGAFVPRVGHAVHDKLRALVRHYPNVDVIFVHRDADRAGPDLRQTEIEQGAVGVIDHERVIPVIPTRMLETWLLADELALRSVAGNKYGRLVLGSLPPINRLETVPDSKELLCEVLCEASETQGGKLKKFRKGFSQMRARLAIDLDPDGPVSNLPSYQAFRARIREFAATKLNVE